MIAYNWDRDQKLLIIEIKIKNLNSVIETITNIELVLLTNLKSIGKIELSRKWSKATNRLVNYSLLVNLHTWCFSSVVVAYKAPDRGSIVISVTPGNSNRMCRALVLSVAPGVNFRILDSPISDANTFPSEKEIFAELLLCALNYLWHWLIVLHIWLHVHPLAALSSHTFHLYFCIIKDVDFASSRTLIPVACHLLGSNAHKLLCLSSCCLSTSSGINCGVINCGLSTVNGTLLGFSWSSCRFCCIWIRNSSSSFCKTPLASSIAFVTSFWMDLISSCCF